MKLPRKQKGWTALGLLTVMIVAGIFISVGFSLAPAYADHRTMQSMMTDTIRDRSLLSKRNREIQLSVIKRMQLNNTALPKGFMKISRDKGTVTIDIDYEIRVPIFANVDAVMSFKDSYEGQELE